MDFLSRNVEMRVLFIYVWIQATLRIQQNTNFQSMFHVCFEYGFMCISRITPLKAYSIKKKNENKKHTKTVSYL